MALLTIGLSWASAAPSAESYLACVRDTIARTRANLPAITASAQAAAGKCAAGGRIWAAGRQEDFIAEACHRAGGLMAIAPLDNHTPSTSDIILYAVPGRLNPEDTRRIEQWRKDGALVVPFDSAAGLYRDRFPLDTVANVVDLWTWTAEFVAASTRLGKMPVLYQTYGLPGGVARGKKYHGKTFHDDLTVKPIAPGKLGRTYLDTIDGMLSQIARQEMPKIQRAAGWWRETKPADATIMVIGHMFPHHFQDPRAAAFGNFATVPAWEDKPLIDEARPPKFVLYVGYQFAPRKLVEQAAKRGVRLVYFDVEPARPAEPAGNILFINPRWPLADGCLTVPGYDVPILPASGVIQAAIFWTVASEREKTPGHKSHEQY